jgi:hypothetical protein
MLSVHVNVRWFVWEEDDTDEPTTTREFEISHEWEPDDGPMIDWLVSVLTEKEYTDEYSSCPGYWPGGWYSYADGSIAHDHYTGEREERSAQIIGADDTMQRAVWYAVQNYRRQFYRH